MQSEFSAADIDQVAKIAQRMADVVNESLRIADGSRILETRRSRIAVARERLKQIQDLAVQFPFLSITRLADVERDIDRIERESDALSSTKPNSVPVRQEGGVEQPSVGSSMAAKRHNRFGRQAQQLGIRHEVLILSQGGPKLWRHGDAGAHSCIEEAALERYRADGWSGTAAEGGLILTLIKLASFARVGARNADTFVEALYAQNVAFEEDRFDAKQLIDTLACADKAQLRNNWRTVSATAGSTPAFYPRVRWEHVEGLFKSLGNRRLAQIATVFATAPYDFRAGWPDLTLWRGNEVRFVEVKSPSDQMHASQVRLISTLLVPLGFDVALAEVRRST